MRLPLHRVSKLCSLKISGKSSNFFPISCHRFNWGCLQIQPIVSAFLHHLKARHISYCFLAKDKGLAHVVTFTNEPTKRTNYLGERTEPNRFLKRSVHFSIQCVGIERSVTGGCPQHQYTTNSLLLTGLTCSLNVLVM